MVRAQLTDFSERLLLLQGRAASRALPRVEPAQSWTPHGRASGHTDPNSGTILNRQEKLGPLRVRCDTALMPFYGIAGMPTSGEVTPIASA
jgi:hypothetical protein